MDHFQTEFDRAHSPVFNFFSSTTNSTLFINQGDLEYNVPNFTKFLAQLFMRFEGCKGGCDANANLFQILKNEYEFANMRRFFSQEFQSYQSQ